MVFGLWKDKKDLVKEDIIKCIKYFRSIKLCY